MLAVSPGRRTAGCRSRRHTTPLHDLIERNLAAGRGTKTAFIDDRGSYSYAELADRVSRFAALVRRRGIHPEQRILLCLHDTIDFPTAFLGAIKAGIVPVPVNTLLTADDYAYMLADSRARAVVVVGAAVADRCKRRSTRRCRPRR